MRARGGYIGANVTPASAGINSAASGVWTVREAEALKRAGTWPRTAAVPETISGLQLWLDASDASTLFNATTGGSLVAADGGVARWEDKSGNGRHATQSTSGNRPLRKTAIQGGKDVLRFDGSNDLLSIPNSATTFKFLHNANSTVFAVFKSGTTANPGHSGHLVFGTISAGTSSQTGAYLATVDSDPSTANDMVDWFVARGQSGTWPVYSANNNYFASNVFGMLSLVSKPADATSGNRVALRKNGGSLSTENAPLSIQTVSQGDADDNFTIGAFSGGSYSLNGDIAEIIIYNAALSDTDRALVESYLMSKWAIT
jgi:hypothetical protein